MFLNIKIAPVRVESSHVFLKISKGSLRYKKEPTNKKLLFQTKFSCNKCNFSCINCFLFFVMFSILTLLRTLLVFLTRPPCFFLNLFEASIVPFAPKYYFSGKSIQYCSNQSLHFEH